MTGDFVVSFFKALCPSLGVGSVAVELVDGSSACGIVASVGWLSGRWHILVNRHLGAKSLLRTLLHEAAHVKFGDVPKGHYELVFQGQRDLMTGKATFGAVERHQAAARRDGDQAAQAQEARADKWADDQMAVYWPVVVGIDATVKTAVQKALGRVTA